MSAELEWNKMKRFWLMRLLLISDQRRVGSELVHLQRCLVPKFNVIDFLCHREIAYNSHSVPESLLLLLLYTAGIKQQQQLHGYRFISLH